MFKKVLQDTLKHFNEIENDDTNKELAIGQLRFIQNKLNECEIKNKDNFSEDDLYLLCIRDPKVIEDTMMTRGDLGEHSKIQSRMIDSLFDKMKKQINETSKENDLFEIEIPLLEDSVKLLVAPTGNSFMVFAMYNGKTEDECYSLFSVEMEMEVMEDVEDEKPKSKNDFSNLLNISGLKSATKYKTNVYSDMSNSIMYLAILAPLAVCISSHKESYKSFRDLITEVAKEQLDKSIGRSGKSPSGIMGMMPMGTGIGGIGEMLTSMLDDIMGGRMENALDKTRDVAKEIKDDHKKVLKRMDKEETYKELIQIAANKPCTICPKSECPAKDISQAMIDVGIYDQIRKDVEKANPFILMRKEGDKTLYFTNEIDKPEIKEVEGHKNAYCFKSKKEATKANKKQNNIYTIGAVS